MKRFRIISLLLCLFVLAGCGGGDLPVAAITASGPQPTRAAAITGGQGVAIRVYQALYGQAPSNAQLSSFVSQIGSGNGFAWANSMSTSFNNLSDAALSTLVLNNISITPTSLTSTTAFGTSLQAYTALQGALADYFGWVGVSNRGIVIAQLSELLSNSEIDTQFGVYGNAAVAFNQQASANLSYSSNAASDIPATITSSASPIAATTLTPLFVRIPGGSYVMGDHFNFVDPDHPSDEIPLHSVTISPFYMATTLVTNTEYAAYLNAALKSGLIEVRSGIVYAVGGSNILFYTSSSVPLSTISYANSSFTVRVGRELHPVTGVRWFGAAAFANWLSTRDGYTPCYNLSTGACDLTQSGYRLPTEAEWEYAARGGQTNPYYQFPWGNDTNADGRLSNWQNSGDPWENGDYPHTTPVGFYNGSLRNKSDYNWPAADASYQTRDSTNAFGLTDMAGNVWQWVNDWYSNTYYQYCVTNNITVDPPGPTSGDIMQGNLPWRAMRGGTWWNGGGQQFLGYSRVSNRDPSWSLGGSPDSNPDSAWLQVGFRVIRPDRTSTTSTSNTIGLMVNTSKAFTGYTLMSPLHSTATYLLNNAGQYVHKWTSTGEPGRSSYLLENGHMIRASAMPNVGPSTGGGEGGRIEEYDWSGNLVWGFNYYGASYIAHHDFKVLPNGNVLILASEKKSYAEVIAAGFNPALLDSSIVTQGYMLPDYLVEVKPTGSM